MCALLMKLYCEVEMKIEIEFDKNIVSAAFALDTVGSAVDQGFRQGTIDDPWDGDRFVGSWKVTEE